MTLLVQVFSVFITVSVRSNYLEKKNFIDCNLVFQHQEKDIGTILKKKIPLSRKRGGNPGFAFRN